MRGISKTEYVDDVVVQRAVERTFMNLIQSCIDLSQHIRASEDSPQVERQKNEIESLGNAGILPHDVQNRWKKPSGFGISSPTGTVM